MSESRIRIRRRGRLTGQHWLVLWSATAVTLGFLLIPTVVVAAVAVGDQSFVKFPPEGFTLRWFQTIDDRYWQAARVSVVLAAVTTAGAIVLGVPAALALVRGRFRSRPALEGLLRLPLQVPYVVVGVAFLQYYSWINRGTSIDLWGTFPGLVVAHVAIVIPFMIAAVSASLSGLNRDVDLAAYGLGANPGFTLFRITLPSIAPAIVAGSIFSFLVSFDNVPVSLFLIGGSQKTLPIEMFFDAEIANQPSLYAVGTVIALGSAAVVLIVQRLVGLTDSLKFGGGVS
jgi:putative spermidine/putrescine transport system permease protein